jgi:transcriptional regulator with XRE-family HTH domain
MDMKKSSSKKPRFKKSEKIDKHIGLQFKKARILCGLTQEEIGKKMHVSYQQVQKYETGHNQLSPSRLYDASLVIEQPVGYFFEGLQGQDVSKKEVLFQDDIANAADLTRGDLELIKLFYQISNKEVRKGLKILLKAIIDQH